MGVIINNWGHIITFWGRGFIGGDYHYLGARLLATSVKVSPGQSLLYFAHSKSNCTKMVNGQRRSVPKLNQERSDRAFQAKNTDSLEPRSISQHPISSIYARFQSDSTIPINQYLTGPPHFRIL